MVRRSLEHARSQGTGRREGSIHRECFCQVASLKRRDSGDGVCWWERGSSKGPEHELEFGIIHDDVITILKVTQDASSVNLCRRTESRGEERAESVHVDCRAVVEIQCLK